MEAVCGALNPYLLSSSLTGSLAQLPWCAAVSEVAACPQPPAQPAHVGSLDLCLRRAGEQLCPSYATFSVAAARPHVPRPAPHSCGHHTAVPTACSVCPHLPTAHLWQLWLPGLEPHWQPPSMALAPPATRHSQDNAGMHKQLALL